MIKKEGLNSLGDPNLAILCLVGWIFIVEPVVFVLTRHTAPSRLDYLNEIIDLSIQSIIAFLVYKKIRKQQFTLTSLEPYKRLFEETPTPMYSYNAVTLQLLSVNASALHHYGYSREEFLKLRITDLEPENAEVQFRETNRQEQISYFSDVGRHQHRRQDGALFYIRLFIHEVNLKGKQVIQVLAIDDI